MKKLIYFMEICALCVIMATGCTNNKTENSQVANNLNVEQIKNMNKDIFTVAMGKMGNKISVQLDKEYFIIDKNSFTEIFNQTLGDSQDVEGIKEWKHTIEENENTYKEIYRTGVHGSSIKLVKSKTDEKYLGIIVDSLYSSVADLYRVSDVVFLVSAICEGSGVSEEFTNDMLNALNSVVVTEENQYVQGKEKKYCFSYNGKVGMITFYIMPSTKTEEQIMMEKVDKKVEEESNDIDLIEQEEIEQTSSDFSKPTEREIEIYNYINDLLEIGADTSQEPSVSEIASYFDISEEMVNGNFKAYKQSYLEHIYEDYCDKMASEKYGISIDEINEIWLKVYTYENK